MVQRQDEVQEQRQGDAPFTDVVRDLTLAAMLEKIADDPYPSTSMMDQVEAILTPARRGQYAQILLEKVRGDRFPSWDMLKRLIRLGG